MCQQRAANLEIAEQNFAMKLVSVDIDALASGDQDGRGVKRKATNDDDGGNGNGERRHRNRKRGGVRKRGSGSIMIAFTPGRQASVPRWAPSRISRSRIQAENPW